MKATKYPYGTNNSGFYCQLEKPADVYENITKKELMSMADLRHPVLNKSEYYRLLSTDINGKPKPKFQLLCSTYLLVVEQ